MARKSKSNTNTSEMNNRIVEGEFEYKHFAKSEGGITDKKAKEIIEELTKQFVDRTKNDIRKWKLARELAEDIVMPRWESLQNIFKDVSDDLHLESVIGQRIKKLTGCKFKIVDDSGKENEDATKLLKTAWFKRLIRLHGESKFYKYSLIQFGDLLTDRFGKPTFQNIKLVDRRYIISQNRECLLNLHNSTGISFDERPWSLWTMYVEDETTDFGLIGKAAPLLLMKRNVMVAWSQFTEIFGLPFRKATTTSRDQTERKRIENMLSSMGKSAWGLFPEGTNLELIESNRTDSYKVFDAFIERIDSQISKAMLGQTGTTDEKAFVGAAKVHDETLDDIIQDDMSDVEFWINGEVIPFLISHGFQLDKLYFQWDTKKQESKAEKSDKALKVSQMGWKPTKEWIEQELDVLVDEPEPAPDPKQDPKQDPQEPDMKAIMAQLKALYN